MKTIILVLSLTLSSVAFADTLDRDIKRLQKLAEVGTNGGEAIVSTYKVAQFNYKPLIKNLLSSIKGNECRYTPSIGVRKTLWENIGAFEIYRNSDEAMNLLEKLDRAGKIKGALGYYWNGDSGDSEYCSTESLDIYFTNGKVLFISLDNTT